MHFIRIISSFLLLLTSAAGVAQEEYSVFQFRNNVQMDFNLDPPMVKKEGEISSLGARGKGISFINDRSGKLLIYTDGIEVRNRLHQKIMPDLLPDSLVAVSTPILIRKPNSDNRILLFYSADRFPDTVYDVDFLFAEFEYYQDSIKLIYRDSVLMNGTTWYKFNAAKIRCDSSIIMLSNTNQDTTYVFPVLEDKIGNDPIIFNTRLFDVSNQLEYNYYFNYPNHWIIENLNLTNLQVNHYCTLSGEDTLKTKGIGIISPDGSKFYAVEEKIIFDTPNSGTTVGSYLFQYDLNKPDKASIQASKTLIFGGSLSSSGELNSMMLGPDGNIYFTALTIPSLESSDESDFIIYRISDPDSLESNVRITEFYRTPARVSETIFDHNIPLNTIVPQTDFEIGAACQDSIVRFNSIGQPGSYYEWNFGDPGSGADNTSTDPNPSHVYTEPGEYIVRMEPGCVTRQVTVSEVPVLDLGDARTFCYGESVRLNVPDYPSTVYSWSHTQQDTSSYKAILEGQYWVEARNSCTSVSDTVYLERIDPVFNIALSVRGTCMDDSTLLSVSYKNVVDPPREYHWEVNEEEYRTDSSGLGLKLAPGMYSATLRIFSEGCLQGDSRLDFQVEDRPTPSLGPDQQICYDEEVILNAGGYKTPVTYAWSTGSTDQTIKADSSALYTITVLNGCDTVTDSVVIDFIPRITSQLPNDTVVCQGSFAVLDAGNAHPAISYLWNDGSTVRVREVLEPGDYWVDISSRCNSVRDSLSLFFIRPETGLEAPNVITPNGDGRNDTFEVLALDNPDFQLSIYDRWGKVLYKTRDPYDYWDGTYAGEVVPAGTYFWAVEGRNCYNDPEVYKGFISVLRSDGARER